jgi:hypothetical protein
MLMVVEKYLVIITQTSDEKHNSIIGVKQDNAEN